MFLIKVLCICRPPIPRYGEVTEFFRAELQRQIRIRGGHQAAATQIINAVNVLLEVKLTAEHRILLWQKFNALQWNMEIIQALDEVILELVEDRCERERMWSKWLRSVLPKWRQPWRIRVRPRSSETNYCNPGNFSKLINLVNGRFWRFISY